MNKTKLKFISECPAWAQRLGVKNLRIWDIIRTIMPLTKSERFDCVDELNSLDGNFGKKISDVEKILILQVVGTWDEMAGTEI